MSTATFTTNGATINGHTTSNDAGPSKTRTPPTPPNESQAPSQADSSLDGIASIGGIENGSYTSTSAAQAHDALIVDHIYQVGFRQGRYADINLLALDRSYRLHALILSRSPYLDGLIRTTRTNQIFVPLDQTPHITIEAFDIVLGYLYSSSSIHLVSAQNARAVLATASLLGGMEDLCTYAYEICKASISAETIYEWLDFIASIPYPPSPSASSPVSTALEVSENDTADPVFGVYGPRLREDVFSFLVVTLPTLVEGETNGLLDVYARLPFEYFKAAIESPAFPIGSTHERFKFAKAAVALRKTGVARGAEESVVLAFGGVGEGSAVHVTRKVMRKKALWKVTK